jgi:hypothetical protein
VKRTYERATGQQLLQTFIGLCSARKRKGGSQTKKFPAYLSQFAPTTDFFQKNYGAGEPWIDNWKEFAIFYRLEKIVEAAGRRLASR